MKSQEQSKNLTPQLQKQENSLINYIGNRNELAVVQAAQNPILAQANASTMQSLVDVVAKWRWAVGVSSNPNEDDLAKEMFLICKFIAENYSALTLQDIELSIEMSLTNKLDVEVNPYNSFSPLYVSRILNAFIQHKQKTLNEVISRKLAEDSKKEPPPPSPSQKKDDMAELITYFYEQYKAEGEVKDLFNTLYNYLRRTGKMKPSKEVVDKAMEYGKKMAISFHQSVIEEAVISREKPDTEKLQKRFARNYCVQHYFDNFSLESIIANMNEKEFE